MSSSCVVAAGCDFNCVEVEVEEEVELEEEEVVEMEMEDSLFSDPFSPSLDCRRL